MSGVNQVILLGRLGRAPELQRVKGHAKCYLNIATSYKTDDGDEVVSWHRVTVWRRQAEACTEHLRKGSEVYVVGFLSYGSYDKDGEKVYTTDIVAREVHFIGGRPGGSNG